MDGGERERQTPCMEFVEIVMVDWEHATHHPSYVLYEGTRVLYELLFMKNTTNYTKNDKKKHIETDLKTNLNRRGYEAYGQINGNFR